MLVVTVRDGDDHNLTTRVLDANRILFIDNSQRVAFMRYNEAVATFETRDVIAIGQEGNAPSAWLDQFSRPADKTVQTEERKPDDDGPVMPRHPDEVLLEVGAP